MVNAVSMDNVEHAYAVQQLRKSGKNAKIVSRTIHQTWPRVKNLQRTSSHLKCAGHHNNCLNTEILSLPRPFVVRGKCRSLFLDPGTGRRCPSTRRRKPMRRMATTMVAKVPMQEQAAAARVPAGVRAASAVAAAGGIAVPRETGASRRVLTDDHKHPLLRQGPPRWPWSSPARMKVSNTKFNPLNLSIRIMWM